MPIVERAEHHPNPRQRDGRLWCGHDESSVVVEGDIAYCGACDAETGGRLRGSLADAIEFVTRSRRAESTDGGSP